MSSEQTENKELIRRFQNDAMFHALTETLFRLLRDEDYSRKDIEDSISLAEMKLDRDRKLEHHERHVSSMLKAYED